jgi:hypothetical protein
VKWPGEVSLALDQRNFACLAKGRRYRERSEMKRSELSKASEARYGFDHTG